MITAVILAAGASKRMGQPKMLLPWGEGTVLSHVISVFRKAGVDDIVVVTGGARKQVERIAAQLQVRSIFNENYAEGEMLLSLQLGIGALTHQAQGMLVGLGDQPQVEERSVRTVCEMFLERKSLLVVPSYRMRRGHPWLIGRSLWDTLLDMKPPQTSRDFLNTHTDAIQYVDLDDAGILADLDTPADYEKWKP